MICRKETDPRLLFGIANWFRGKGPLKEDKEDMSKFGGDNGCNVFFLATDKTETTLLLQCGYYDEHSRKVRQQHFEAVTQLPFGHDVAIQCDSEDEAFHCQHALAEVLRPLRVKDEMFIMPLNDKQRRFLGEWIKSTLNAENRSKIRLEFSKKLMTAFRSQVKKKKGSIYLIETADGRYKIGQTQRDVAERKMEIDATMQQRTKVIDTKESNDCDWDEAALHMLCSKWHHPNDYLNRPQPVYLRYCNELFFKDDNVLNTWKEYWNRS